MFTKNCIYSLLAFAALSAASAAETAKKSATAENHNWTSWRGPLQTGVSTEHYKSGKLNPTPAWVYDTKGRGAPVVCDGKLFSWGYRGETTELVEVLSCLDAKTGVKIWEHEFKDFLSDTVYDRYTIGAPTVDPETKRVYLTTH